MENKPQNVFEKLDSIEETQSVTKAQSEEILKILKDIRNQQVVNQNYRIKHQPQETGQILKYFLKSSRKEHLWFGTTNDFNKYKKIIYILCIALIFVGIISTILTSIALNMYSTFTLFENIWLIFVCIMFSYAVKAKKRMTDTDLMEHSNRVFIQDADWTWRNTNKEKKKYRWFRRISYIAIVGNIICLWSESETAIAISATMFELAFAGLSIGLVFAYINLYCMYGNFILYTGKNASNTETVTLIFDVMGNKLAPYEEYKGKMKELL